MAGDEQPDEGGVRPAGTGRRAAVVVALVAVVGLPALHPGQPDGFPLSTYPMFASARGREISLATAVGVDRAGGSHRLDPVAIGGTSEVMQASETLDLAVVVGEPELSRLCGEIAGRVVADPELVAVELRSETYDAIAWFDGDHQPSSSVTHVRCEVPR